MATPSYDPVDAARLLRELAGEIEGAEGVARNGLFLELHRLLDTLFRLTLEGYSETEPELAGQAFNVVEAMPAPKVVRELNRLGSPLAATELRNLYKHMNMARNTLAHEPVVGRYAVSRANSKRMARLAQGVAAVLDPDQLGQPDPSDGTALPVRRTARTRLYLVLGVVAGAGLVAAWVLAPHPALALAASVLVLTELGALWVLEP